MQGTLRKSIYGFPLVSCMGIGVPLGNPLGRRSFATKRFVNNGNFGALFQAERAEPETL